MEELFDHYCVHCNSLVLSHSGNGTVEIVCGKCRMVQSIFGVKTRSGDIAGDFKKDCVAYYCSERTCRKQLAKTDGEVEFIRTCPKCYTKTVVTKNTGIALQDATVAVERIKKKLIPSPVKN